MGRCNNFLLLFVTITFITASVAEGRRVRVRPFLALDAGVAGTSVYQRYTVNPENQSVTSSIAGFIRLRKGWRLFRTVLLEPSLGLMVPWRSSADGNAKYFTFHVNSDFGWQLLSFLKLRVGPGVQWVLMVSSAGEVTLDNGNGTSTFFVPGGISNSFTPTANIGFEILFSKSFSINFDSFILNPILSSRRRVNAAITLGFKL